MGSRSLLRLATRRASPNISSSSIASAQRFVRTHDAISPMNQQSMRMLGGSSGGKGGSLIEGVKRFFGQDEESRERRARERAIKDAIDSAVPSHLPGLGLMGRAWIALVKTFAARILGTFADSMADIGKIHSGASRCIVGDKNVRALLGEDIQCSAPYTSSASSTQTNNVSSSHIAIAFPVSGTLGVADAKVVASVDADKNINITSILVATRDGASVHVHINKKHKTVIDV